MKNITIKSDKHLYAISAVLGMNAEETIRFIESLILEEEPYIDDRCNAGDNLFDVLYNSEFNIKALLRRSFPPETWKDFSKLTLWGVEEDCLKCGCEMDFIEEDRNEEGYTGYGVYRCINCGNEEER